MIQMTLFGNVGRDPELKYSKDGSAYLPVIVGVDTGWGDRKETLWVRCMLYKTRAEKLAPIIVRGMKVAVIGDMEPIKFWTDKEGNPRPDVSINVREIQFGSAEAKPKNAVPEKRAEEAPRSSPPPRTAGGTTTTRPATFEDDDIPF
jgi:single-strand DNA-binding protein